MPVELMRRAPQFQARTPDDPEHEAVIDNFRAFAKKSQEELIPPQFGFVVSNIRFSDTSGSITKRASRAKFGGMATLGTSKITHTVRYYKSSAGTKKLVIAYDTTLKVGSDTAGTFANIKTGQTADQQYTSLVFKNLLYLANGVDTTQVFDLAQSATQNVGVPVPGAATAAVGAATGLTGAYSYKVTYEIDSYQEGNAGTASNTVNPANEKVSLSAIPTSANTRVTARNIYRTLTGGAVYYFLVKISDNTTTVYTDSIADGSLDTARTAPADYGTLDQAYRYVVLHKSRLFHARGATDKSKGVYSDVRLGTAYPDVYPANNFAYIRRDDGEDITFFGEDQFGQLIAMKANAIVKINTDTDSPLGWSGTNNVLSSDGCQCPFSGVRTTIGILYVGGFGEAKRRLMLWDGTKTQQMFPELEPLLSAAPRSQNDQFIGAYRDGFYYLAFNDPDKGTLFNNTLLIIDLVNNVYTLDDKNIQCFSVWSSRNDFGELYTGSSDTTGLVLREDTNVQDVLVRTLSDLDRGTYNQTESNGTEESPTLNLIQSELLDDIGAQLISAATVGTIADYADTLETIAPSGLYTSEIFEVNAVNLGSILWTEHLGTKGLALFRVRTGDTLAAIAVAAWSTDFSTAAGSSLSAITARKYIQFQCQLYVQEADVSVSEAPNIYLYRDVAPGDFVVKITLGQGVLTESTIAMEYESAWLDFGWLDPMLKNRRKHIKRAKIEFERSVATGSLIFGWRSDYQTAAQRTDASFAFSTYASRGFCMYRFPLGTYAKRMKYRLYHADDTSALKITRVVLVFSVEPETSLF
jgi:hypothetical protein